eukprot:TRINITY_DN55146_c0_g1_i1.p1 TRINITY_DN55146_c0_g1~~TRINITY_DN55146_c0_g1_i1.p1  ORF type:complete len:317 (+),score=37.90 TRINITY_DN55146_c0_g1_i1:44-994(+)
MFARWSVASHRVVGMQVAEAFAELGFVPRIRVLSHSEAATALGCLEGYEQTRVGQSLRGDDRFKIHLLFPWAAALVRHPVLVDAVGQALGTRNIVVWSSDFNIKEPNSSAHYTPHQDSTYMGLCPAEQILTAWIALTPASEDMGCLRCLPGSHRFGQLPHTEGNGGADNQLALGQAACLPASVASPAEGGFSGPAYVALPLEAGEASLHSSLSVHVSGPNNTSQRRVGLAVRYMAASVRHTADPPTSLHERTLVTLVSGDSSCVCDEFEIESEPSVDLGKEECMLHAEAMRREKARYFQNSASGAAEDASTSCSYK